MLHCYIALKLCHRINSPSVFLYNASGVTTTKIFLGNPTVTHHQSGIYFGVNIPLNLTALFKPAGSK